VIFHPLWIRPIVVRGQRHLRLVWQGQDLDCRRQLVVVCPHQQKVVSQWHALVRHCPCQSRPEERNPQRQNHRSRIHPKLSQPEIIGTKDAFDITAKLLVRLVRYYKSTPFPSVNYTKHMVIFGTYLRDTMCLYLSPSTLLVQGLQWYDTKS